MTIVPYDEKYRDDMIFMILQAKDALGRVPRLNEDLLDIRANYLERGDEFWLALDEDGASLAQVLRAELRKLVPRLEVDEAGDFAHVAGGVLALLPDCYAHLADLEARRSGFAQLGVAREVAH